VIALAPARPGTHRDLGMIYLVIGRLEAAAAELTQETAREPKGPGAARDEAIGSAWEGLGIAAYRLGDDAQALAALAKAPETIDARYHRGLALARSGDNERAAAELREVLKRDPDHRGALQNLARVAGSLGHDDERRQLLERFSSLYAQDEQRRSLRIRVRDSRKQAEDRMAAGDVPGAVAAMERAAQTAPDDIDLLLDLSRLYTKSGDAARSEQTCRAVLAKDPLRAEAHYRLGRIQADRGDLSSALASLEQAARLEPLSLTYHSSLAQVYMRGQRAGDAVRELRLARRLSPSDPATAFNLGLGLAQAGQMREAAEQLETAVGMGLSDPAVHQALAAIYKALGDVERSEKEKKIYETMARPPGAGR